MSTYFEQTSIVGIARKRFRHLFIIGLVGAVCGFLFSGEWFIKPKYKSMAIVYPVNIIPYSSETPSEQLLQLFSSADVRSMMVKRFRLAATYAIDTTAKSGKTRLFATYDENVMVRKTEFESVQLHVYDTDPDTACRMVAELIRFVDLKARLLQREKTMEVVNIFKTRLAQNQRQIDSLEQLMQVLRVRYGLLDYKSQSKEVTRNYLKMVGEGASGSRLATVDTLMNNLQRKGGELLWVSDQLDQLRKDYGEVRSEYDRAMSDLTKELTYTNVVASPFPSDSKAYPVRWVIMLTVTVASVFLGLLLFIFLDKNKAAAAHGSTT